jgi:small subunit ribosomal protein S17e|tara:strand:- start:1462 stop:1701 length:240 start_codon:yes stop_codon:yes gene_type:complete
MGRIKTVLVKRITKQLVKEHGEEFSDDFDKNKEVLAKYTNIESRKIRNVVAGYASRLTQQAKEGKVRRSVNKEDISKFY